MLAGIGGIDLVLLVVALDEGVMPQTVEHFEILKMLHIKQGIVVFTKADLVMRTGLSLLMMMWTIWLKVPSWKRLTASRYLPIPEKNIDVLKQMIVDKVRAAGARRRRRSCSVCL